MSGAYGRTLNRVVRCLDLFCCAGGAGEGYRRAGFDVTGVDIRRQYVLMSVHEHWRPYQNQGALGGMVGAAGSSHVIRSNILAAKIIRDGLAEEVRRHTDTSVYGFRRTIHWRLCATGRGVSMSIALSLRETLGGCSVRQRKCITSTGTKPTTDCPICGSFPSQSIAVSLLRNSPDCDKKCSACNMHCVKPSLLDLFCGAGGCARGYQYAGFCVLGIDLVAQRHYAGCRFIQGDALAFLREHGHEFDFIHASPPCQAHCDLKHMWNAKKHADLIGPTRVLLRQTGKPWIIENVEGAPLETPVILCGTMFGLGTGDAELRRHRLFELGGGLPPLLVPPCQHKRKPRVIGVYGGHGRDRQRKVNTQDFSTDARREAMGIDWMTGAELSQAIPPAYTEFLGRHALAYTANIALSAPCKVQ